MWRTGFINYATPYESCKYPNKSPIRSVSKNSGIKLTFSTEITKI